MLCIRFDSLPVASVSMVGEADGVPLVDGDGCVAVVLLVVLGSVEMWYIRTCTWGSHFAKVLNVVHYVSARFASLPVLTMLVGVVDRVPLVTGGEPVLVEVWPCVTVLVDVVDGVPLVGSGVAVGVVPTVLVLLVVVDPVEMCEIYMYMWGSLYTYVHTNEV